MFNGARETMAFSKEYMYGILVTLLKTVLFEFLRILIHEYPMFVFSCFYNSNFIKFMS